MFPIYIKFSIRAQRPIIFAKIVFFSFRYTQSKTFYLFPQKAALPSTNKKRQQQDCCWCLSVL